MCVVVAIYITSCDLFIFTRLFHNIKQEQDNNYMELRQLSYYGYFK